MSNVSLLELQKQHKLRMNQLKEESEKRYRTVCASAQVACGDLCETTNAEMLDVFAVEQQIENQFRELTQRTEQYQKQMQQWGVLFTKFNGALKELGDVANWSSHVERDLTETVKILEDLSAKKRIELGLKKKS